MSHAETAAAGLAAATPPPGSRTRGKRPEDTPEGCRALAAADRDRIDGFAVEQARARYERSAAAWTARADLLDRLEAKFQARTGELAA